MGMNNLDFITISSRQRRTSERERRRNSADLDWDGRMWQQITITLIAAKYPRSLMHAVAEDTRVL